MCHKETREKGEPAPYMIFPKEQARNMQPLSSLDRHSGQFLVLHETAARHSLHGKFKRVCPGTHPKTFDLGDECANLRYSILEHCLVTCKLFKFEQQSR